MIGGPASAQNQTINGNLTVTGTIGSAGAIDSDANTFSFGSQGGSYGAALLYQDNSTDTFTFSANRNPASWLWLHTTAIAAMRLDANHQLILYKADGASAGITLTPANNSIKLGTHANGTLTADANGVITAAGGFSVAGGLTNTNGSFTGGASGLTLNAGGTNQNITLNSSGGDLVFNTNGSERMRVKAATGNVGIGINNPSAKLHVYSTTIGGLLRLTDSESDELQIGENGGGIANRIDVRLFDTPETPKELLFWGGGATNGYNMGSFRVQATTHRFMGGNVGIGTASPSTKLDIAGDGSTASILTVRSRQTNAYMGLVAGVADDAVGEFAFERTGPTAGNIYVGGNATGNVIFRSGGYAHKMLINAAGNVGIGTTNPQAKLDVIGSMQVTGSILQQWGSYKNYVQYPSAYATNPTYLMGWMTDPATRRIFIDNQNNDSSVTDPNGGITFRTGGTLTDRMHIGYGGNVGIGTTTPQASLDVVGRTLRLSNLQPEYRLDFGGGQDLNWKTIANVTLGTGLYVGTNFIVQVFDADNNYGVLTSAKFLTYYAAMTRSSAAQDDTNNAKVSGPLNEYVRVVKVGTGIYELQVRQPADWKRIIVTARAYAINSLGSGGAINYVNTPVNGATTGTIYTPTSGHMDYMTNGYFAGNVGIGTTTPTHKLAVNGTIRAKEVIVDTGWADYVFEDDYRLAPLAEVEQHIREKKHLPGIPSAAEVAEHGVSMGEMQTRMMAKIEELTLHLIRMEKENAALRDRVQALESASTTP